MKQSERRKYSDVHVRNVKRFERKHTPAIFAAILKQVETFIKDMKRVGVNEARENFNTYFLNGEMNEAVKNLYIDSAPFFAEQTAKEIKRATQQKDGRMGDDPEWRALLNSYFASPTFLNDVVIPTTRTTKNQIKRVLTQAINEGWSIDEIARVLRSPQLTESRARLIARTEIGKADFIGRKTAAEDADFAIGKEWITCQDDRVRNWHAAVDGVVVGEREFFTVNGERMEGPGDPTASPENVINCRCTLAIVPLRDRRGNLLPKS